MIVLLVVAVVVLGGTFFFYHNQKVIPVKMTPAEVNSPEKVAKKLGVTRPVAERIVKQIRTVKKPVLVYHDIPVPETDQKIGDAIKNEKPNTAIATEDSPKDIKVYSIHTEPEWRFGCSLSLEDFGLAIKHGNTVYSITKDYGKNRLNLTLTWLF